MTSNHFSFKTDPLVCPIILEFLIDPIFGITMGMTRGMTKRMKWRHIVWIAVRHFAVKRDRLGLSFMTIISVFGVTIGVAALIVVLSVMGGFEAELKRKMLVGRPHLELISATHPTAGFSLKQYPLSLFEKIYPEASTIEPFTQADVVVKRRKMMSPIELYGIDPDQKGHNWGFSNSIVEGDIADLKKLHKLKYATDAVGSKGLPGIIVGEDLAMQLGADVGDELTVLSPQLNSGTILGGGTISRRFALVGKFRSELFNFDLRWAVTSIDEGRKFLPDYDESLDQERYVTGVAIDFKDPMDIDKYSGRIKNRSDVKDIKTLTWQEVNKSLLFALKLEKFAMGSILMLIVLVAAFSISGTMMMMVFHKRNEICCLRSLGMSKKDVTRLFLTHGAVIGVLGIVFGFIVGLGLCTLIYFRHDISLPEGVYVLKALPVRFLPVEYLVIAAAALLLIIVSAIYPAVTAARQDPGTGLRYE